MAGTTLLLASYSSMLWWRTQWQSSSAVTVLLLLAVALLCAYEPCAVYVTAGSTAAHRYSTSGFFFGVSAIALAINMLFICRMVFHGNGLDVDEYVRSAYKYAYSDCIEVGHVSCLLEPPEPNDLSPRQSRRQVPSSSFKENVIIDGHWVQVILQTQGEHLESSLERIAF